MSVPVDAEVADAVEVESGVVVEVVEGGEVDRGVFFEDGCDAGVVVAGQGVAEGGDLLAAHLGVVEAYLRDHRPPTLIVWGPQDGYMPAAAAHAYHRDHPDAELHLLRGGHWLLETNLTEAIPLIRDFLGRTLF